MLFTNTLHPGTKDDPSTPPGDPESPPGHRIEDYVFNQDGTLNNLGRHIFGINYTSLPGREY